MKKPKRKRDTTKPSSRALPNTVEEINRVIREETSPSRLAEHKKNLFHYSEGDRLAMLRLRVGMAVAKKLNPSTPITKSYWKAIDAAVLPKEVTS